MRSHSFEDVFDTIHIIRRLTRGSIGAIVMMVLHRNWCGNPSISDNLNTKPHYI